MLNRISDSNVIAMTKLAKLASTKPKQAVGHWKSHRVLDFIVFVDEVADAIKAHGDKELTPRALKLLLIGQCCRPILNALYRVHGHQSRPSKVPTVTPERSVTDGRERYENSICNFCGATEIPTFGVGDDGGGCATMTACESCLTKGLRVGATKLVDY